MLFVARGMKIALQADDGFSKLLAAGPDVRLRAADVHHRRRRPADHPADRDHAAVRLLRRLVGRRELPAARGPAARLRPGERPTRMNKQISRVALVALLLLAVADRRDDLLAGVGGGRPRGEAGQRDPARRAVPHQARPDLRVRRQDAARRRTSPKKAGGQTLYFRRYPPHGLASQVVGYSTQGRSRAGIERQENAYLTAANANLGTIFDKLTDKPEGHDGHGQQPRPEHPRRRAAARRDGARAESAAPRSCSTRRPARCT